MSTTVHKTPRSGRQSLFFQDLATPVSARRGRFCSPGQAASVSAPWRDNYVSSDLPPPPCFTLEDRSDFSPESGMPDHQISPEKKSDPRTPAPRSSLDFLTPAKNKSDASTSHAIMGNRPSPQQGSAGSTWWSPAKSGIEQNSKEKGSPVEGVVHPGALITLPPPQEVARPELRRDNLLPDNIHEEEWVTVYGFSPGDANMVLREFEKCGVILKHIPGPRNANWMHILYQNRSDCVKALGKNGMLINGVVMVGVRPLHPTQRSEALSERLGYQGFMALPPTRSSGLLNPLKYSPQTSSLQNGSSGGRQPTRAIATPGKSVVSKFMDLMFGV